MLIVGIHTRPAVVSAKKLGLTVYSVDYFGDVDLKEKADIARSIIKQKPYESMGKIAENYSDERLIELAKNLEADCTILTSTLDLKKKNIIGNKPRKMKKIKDKVYQLEKVRKLGIKIPKSETVKDKKEIEEIAKNLGFPVVLKPIRGDGGREVMLLKGFSDIPEIDGKFIIQEYVKGEPISVSTLSTRDESKALSTSRQILGSALLNQKGFAYCGNIIPYHSNKELFDTAEKISRAFKVLGWNGVDFVAGEDYVFMEINPRFQGTFDCIEKAYGINLIDAHIKACEGELMHIPDLKNYSVRMTLYAKERSIVTGNLRNISYDVPCRHAIVEEGEPITTVISVAPTQKKAIEIAEKNVNFIYKNFISSAEIKPVKYNNE